MGKSQRAKGARGQAEAASLLKERGWVVDPIAIGIKREDMIATNPGGLRYSVEVKNQKLIDIVKFRQQAREQAQARKLPWMLMVKIYGGYWLVEKQGEAPEIWR